MSIIFNDISNEEFKELLRLKLLNFKEKNDYTIKEAAIQLDITEKTFSRILKGKFMPSLLTIRKIIKSLGISYNEFFDFEFKEINDVRTK